MEEGTGRENGMAGGDESFSVIMRKCIDQQGRLRNKREREENALKR
jgi:hypothetical protein